MACAINNIWKKLCIIFIGFLSLSQATAHAEQMYVMDTLAITMRSGPGIEFRVIASLETGDKVTVLEKSGEWSRVKISGDREGWVLTRYISSKKPNYMLVEALTAQAQACKERLDTLEQENRAFKTESEELSSTLQQVEKDYTKLKNGAQEYLTLKEEHRRVLTTLETLQTTNDELTAENNALKSANNVKWALFGVGVVSISWLVGFILGRTRRKQKSDISFSWK